MINRRWTVRCVASLTCNFAAAGLCSDGHVHVMLSTANLQHARTVLRIMVTLACFRQRQAQPVHREFREELIASGVHLVG